MCVCVLCSIILNQSIGVTAPDDRPFDLILNRDNLTTFSDKPIKSDLNRI